MAELLNLPRLFVVELRDTYDSEKQIVKALPKVIKATHSEELRDAFRRI